MDTVTLTQLCKSVPTVLSKIFVHQANKCSIYGDSIHWHIHDKPDLIILPGNENEVGLGIKDSGVPREEIFLTSKLWNTHHPNVAEGLQKTLDALDVEYLDLYVSIIM